ncbi:MAG TPA: cobalamin-binding protein [Xanthomonadales bacterium]
MTGRPARASVGRILLALVFFSGLGAAQASSAAITLLQANGDTLSLDKPAESIVTLAPNLAELVFAAGAGEHLKAVVEYSNFPARAAQIPRVGDAFRVDLERIVELNPDLVIAWKSGNPQTALQKLQQLGIRVWQVEITRPEEIADVVDNISRAAGTESTGAPAARQLRTSLADLQQKNAGKDPVDYFYQISPRPLYTINGEHIISRSLAICGGRNVFSDLKALAPQISRESVIMANPQVMIAPETSGEPAALLTWGEWPQLQAVQNSALLYLPADEISQATPRLLSSIDLACELLDEVRKKLKKLEK